MEAKSIHRWTDFESRYMESNDYLGWHAPKKKRGRENIAYAGSVLVPAGNDVEDLGCDAID